MRAAHLPAVPKTGQDSLGDPDTTCCLVQYQEQRATLFPRGNGLEYKTHLSLATRHSQTESTKCG